VQDWQALHIVPPKTKFKEAKVHCPPQLQIGTLLLEGPKHSCTSSFVESLPTFKHLGQGLVLHKLETYANNE